MMSSVNSRQCFCQKPVPVYDDVAGEAICSKCGTVLVSSMEHAPVSGDSHSQRNTVPYMSTAKIHVSARMQRAINMSNNTDTSGLTASNNIKSCCVKLGLPAVVGERALLIFGKTRSELRGRSIVEMSAAILFMACREHSLSRDMSEICNAMNAKIRPTRIAYTRLCIAYSHVLPTPSINGFVTRLSSDLKLPEKTTRKALDILRRLSDLNLTAGRKPIMFAAYVVFRAIEEDGLDITNKTVVAAAGVSVVGLKNLLNKNW